MGVPRLFPLLKYSASRVRFFDLLLCWQARRRRRRLRVTPRARLQLCRRPGGGGGGVTVAGVMALTTGTNAARLPDIPLTRPLEDVVVEEERVVWFAVVCCGVVVVVISQKRI